MHSQKIDSERARDAFEELRARFDQQDERRRVTVDVEKAAAQAAAIGRMVQEPAVRERFALLPAEVFDIGHVDALEKAALAAWYAVVERRDAAVRATQAQVPAELVAEAGELKQAMLRLVGYHLRDDGQVAIIADIRAGKGHADTASDLLRLAKLYEANHDILVADRVYYRREDAARASELAHRIHACLGGPSRSDKRIWAGYVRRAWTFLLDTYDEVSAAGRWLYRHEDGDARFPSLISASRQSARRGNAGRDIRATTLQTKAAPEAEDVPEPS